MKKIRISTTCKKLPSDIYTPVGIYLRIRDRFRDTLLLESTDYRASDKSFSFICINAVGGIEITSFDKAEIKYPGFPAEPVKKEALKSFTKVVQSFLDKFESHPDNPREARYALGLFGYTSYDAVNNFETIKLTPQKKPDEEIRLPLIRYRLYQYVIAINHFTDELFLLENHFPEIESRVEDVLSLIQSKDIPQYPFELNGEEISSISDEVYMEMVKKGIQSCRMGDVFQIVLSRRFSRKFLGDEFNVYRALRMINPSPYLFYFDYGNYRLMGSSPEAQLVVRNGKATLHPIAGTFRRTGTEENDAKIAEELLNDSKENSEHVMLVDLARNDLSRSCSDVKVEKFREVQYYSHVIHLVSEVSGILQPEAKTYELLANTFPAGTLSGAPKIRAMELIAEYEPVSRNYYGGALGYLGFDGSCNHAIMIRSFLSMGNTLYYQAGAGVVVNSIPENELQEVNNKLNALKTALIKAEDIGK